MHKEEIAQDLYERKDYLVPFIGDDLFYVNVADGSKQTLQSYIVDAFVKNNPGIMVTPEEIDTMKTSGYYGLTLLNRRFKDKYILHYKEYVKSVKDQIYLNDIVKQFLELGGFPLIITTTPFDFIEKELSKSENYTSIYYSIDNPPVNETIESKDHIVFHLFGQADKFKSKWVYNERELLMFLHSLHDSTTAPKGITSYLADKSMLILGCNLPNWLFQFLWFPMNIQRDPLFPTGEDSTEGYFFGKAEKESHLDDFLQEIGFTSIEEMEDVMKSTIKLYRTTKPHATDRFDVFISYASENYNIARMIKNHLKSKGLYVWIDKDDGNGEVEKGGEYWKRIETGIHHSKYFMPIVTAEYLNKWLLNHTNPDTNEQPGLLIETNMAVEWRKNEQNQFKDEDVYSLPVITDSVKPEVLGILAKNGILPKELFLNMQCYNYSTQNNCTFNSHPWEKYKR